MRIFGEARFNERECGFDVSVGSRESSELLRVTEEELKGESEVLVIPEALWIGQTLRRVEHDRDEALDRSR